MRSAKAYCGALRSSSKTSARPTRGAARGFPAGRTERIKTKGPRSKPRIAQGPLVIYPRPIRVVTRDRKDFVWARDSRWEWVM